MIFCSLVLDKFPSFLGPYVFSYWNSSLSSIEESKMLLIVDCLAFFGKVRIIMVVLWCQVPSEFGKSNGSHLLVNDHNKYKSMWIRAYSSMWMIGGFIAIIYLGHLYIWAMVVVIQIFMARELFNLLRRAHEDKHLPGFRLLNW